MNTSLGRWSPRRLGGWLLAACMLPVSAAVAQTVVTACGTDDAAGGMNLRDALATGGAIVLRCPPPHVIRITARDYSGNAATAGRELPVRIVGAQ